jgi:hypothetical protein
MIQKTIASLFVAILLISKINAQDCNCTIVEVQENKVIPCSKVIGDIINVANAMELRSAIIQVNQTGGNATILLADGVYPVASASWYPYITASNLVIRSASGLRNSVVITGQGMQSVAPGTEIGLSLVGDNITVADLTIRAVGNHAISTSSDNHFIHNVRFQDTYEQMIKGTSGGDTSSDVIVQCSLFEYTAGIGPWHYIGGLDIHEGENWQVRDNIFIDIASPSGSQAEHAVHFWDNSLNNTIERNWIINCDRGIGFGLGSSQNSGGLIKNNMIYNEGSQPYHDVGIGLETSPNTIVANNTVYIAYQNAIEYRFTSTSNVQITNNLVNRRIYSRNGGEATLMTNIDNALGSWFVDTPNGDLHLQNMNALIVNNGTAIPNIVSLDFDQLVRPQGGAFDIGAQEWKEGKDEDMDGFASDVDCDDTDAMVNPDAIEVPYDGLDNDCNPLTLDDDLDMDGFIYAEDCDDLDSLINPNAIEIPNNGIDEDCDGMDLKTSIAELGDIGLIVYPNPTSGLVYIDVENLTNYQLIVYNGLGKAVILCENCNQLDLSSLRIGLYYVQFIHPSTDYNVWKKVLMVK